MLQGKLTQEAVRDLLRADAIALRRGSRRVCPEHLLQAYADLQSREEAVQSQTAQSCGRPRRRPKPRSLSRGLLRIVNRAEAGGWITSDALRRSLAAETGTWSGLPRGGPNAIVKETKPHPAETAASGHPARACFRTPGKPREQDPAPPCNSAGKVLY